MHTRLVRVAAGLVVGVLSLCLLSPPASANTVDIDITDGVLNIYDVDDVLIDDVDLSQGNQDCSPASSSATATGNASSGSITVTVVIDVWVVIGGTYFRVTLVLTLSGSYSVSGSTKTVTLTGSASADLVRTSSGAPCTPLTGAGTCTIDAGNLAVSGPLTVAGTMPTLATGDSATLDGGNSTFDDVVTGNATDCGVMIAANDGRVELVDAVVEVV